MSGAQYVTTWEREGGVSLSRHPAPLPWAAAAIELRRMVDSDFGPGTLSDEESAALATETPAGLEVNILGDVYAIRPAHEAQP